MRGAGAIAALCALLTVVTLPLPATSVEQAGSRPSVLLVTLDTLRADRVGAYGHRAAATPHLDRLAREGILFADATTQSPLTGPAHTALLTGHYPTRLGVKDNASTPLPESALTLAEILKGAGSVTGAFIGAFVLDRPYGFAQGFDQFDASFAGYRPELKHQAQRTAEDVVAPAIDWLGSVPSASPFFAWVHLYDAHAPYAAPAPFAEKFRARPYDGEVAYVDMAVGKLLATLASRGALDRAIVIVVGDHGEALGEHGEDEHGMFLYEAVLRIPFIIRLPKSERAGSVVAEQVRAVDVTPTVLDLLGVEAPGRMDGDSLAAVMRGRPRRDPPPSYADTHFPELHFGWSMLRSWRVGEWKYIEAPKPELYDLRTDRLERRNMTSNRSSVAARMAGELETAGRSFGSAATADAPQPDPDTLARLRSLGYVGIAAPTGRGRRGADPKDKIHELKEFRTLLSRAIDDLSTKRTDAAIDKLKRAVAINERAYDVHVLLGDAWRQKGQHERAIGEYDAAAVLNGSIAAPHVLAADTYAERGLFDDALERLVRAERLEPRSSEVASIRGRVYERSGRAAEALAEYQRAVALNSSDVVAKTRLVSAAMNLKRFDVAESQLRALLSLNHQPGRTHYALGYIAEARGDAATAAEEYRRAVAADPTLQQAKDALARVTKR